VFHGRGGYDWHTVYNMPLWLRKFTFSKIQEHYDKEQKAYDQANTKGSGKNQSTQKFDFANPDKEAFKKLTP